VNAQARQIIGAAIRAARAIDPVAAQDFDAALATLSGRPREKKPDALLLTQAETARLLGCSRWTVRNCVADGTLHPVSLRGAKRYRKAEVLALAGEAD
jgi:hypothetical protein